MIISRLAWNFAKAKALDSLVDKFAGLYRKWIDGRLEHEAILRGYRLDGLSYFSGGSVSELSRRYGLEERLKKYHATVFDSIREYVAQLRELTDYLRDIQVNKRQVPEAFILARMQQAYVIMSRLIDYKPSLGVKKGYSYPSDLGLYLDSIVDMNRQAEKLLEKASGLDSEGSRLRYSAAKRILRWVGKEILQQKGIPAGSLDKIVNIASIPSVELKKKARAAFADYQSVVSLWHSYASDAYAGNAIAA